MLHSLRPSPRRARTGIAVPTAWRSSFGLSLLALAGYVVLAVLLTWPLARHLHDRFPGENPVDAWIHFWNIWWLKVALFARTDPYVTDLWFAPDGADLSLHTLALFNGLLGLLPQLAAGPLVAYNVVTLLTIALAGLTTFLLARHLTGSAGAAFVAGLAFAGSPYLLGHLNVGHLNVAALAPLPLFLLGLLRAAEGSRASLLVAAASLAVSALSEWHTTIFALMAGGVLIGWQALLAAQRRSAWSAPPRAVAACVLGGLLLLPLALRTARAVAEAGGRAELGERWAERHSANLLAYLLPQDLHPLWNGLITTWRERNLQEVLTEGRVSLGLTVLLLAGLGLLAQRQRAVPWLVIAGLGIMLGLGPVLHVGQREFDIVMPFDLFDLLPYADVSRTPARFSVLAVLALAVLLAFGVRWLAGRFAWRWSPVVTAGIAGLLVVAEFWTAPYPLTVPPDAVLAERIGREIAASDPQGTVLTLPYRAAEQERLYHQVYHGRPIFGGFIARDIERPFRTSTPGFADLALPAPFVDIFEPTADPLATLNYYHVGYVLFYRGELQGKENTEMVETIEAALRRVLRQPAPTLVSSDGTLEAWRVPRAEVTTPFLRPGQGWYPVETAGPAGRMRWLGAVAELYVERPREMTATLTFTAWSLGEPRRLEVRLGETVLGVFTIEQGPTEVQVPLPAGHDATMLVLRSLDGADSPTELGIANDKRELSVALARVRLERISDHPGGPGEGE